MSGSKAPSEHDTRREWKLRLNYDGEMSWSAGFPIGQEIHVREVRPGEITLTKEEWLKLKNEGLAGLWRGKHHSMVEFMQAKLFPEGKEVT